MSRIDEALRRASAQLTNTRGVLSVAAPLPQRGALEQFPLEQSRVAEGAARHPPRARQHAAPAAVRSAVEAPVVGHINRLPMQEPPSDACRRLAAALAGARKARGIRAVMVSSAVDGEGHGAVALDLAADLSHAGEPVLLIDADRDASYVRTLIGGASPSAAVTRLANGYLDSFVKVSEYLSVLAAPGSMDARTVGPASERLSSIVDERASMFHWVVLLAPPVSLLADAAVLAGRIGAVAFAIGARTPFAVAQRALAQFDRGLVVGTIVCGLDEGRDSAGPHST